MKHQNAMLQLLRQLVHECTPLRIPSDLVYHGVQAPSKSTLEQARRTLLKYDESKSTKE